MTGFTEGKKERKDERLESCRTEGMYMYKRNAGLEGSSTRGIQDKRDAGREGCKAGGMQDWRDAELK